MKCLWEYDEMSFRASSTARNHTIGTRNGKQAIFSDEKKKILAVRVPINTINMIEGRNRNNATIDESDRGK